jgi:hypothetical protein
MLQAAFDLCTAVFAGIASASMHDLYDNAARLSEQLEHADTRLCV